MNHLNLDKSTCLEYLLIIILKFLFLPSSAVLFCCRLNDSNVENASFSANNFIVTNGRSDVNGKRLLLQIV